MSGSVDNRIVNMQFNNAAFERGIKQTNASLEGLQKNLNFGGTKTGLDALANATNKFSFAGMAAGLDNISSKFGAMGAIGFTVVQSLTNSVLGFAKRTAGALLGPLVEGGKTRAHAIEQAKFQFEGLGLNVEKTMASALKAVKGTAFGLDEAATAAASLGASNVKVGKDMTSVLRAIAGVAALTGSSYSDIADVFQKVAGQGRLMGDDLNRLASRGVNAAAILAKSMHKTEPEIREMVTKGKISFEEFSKAMDKSFGKHATEASKTFTGALANMKAALARIGADVATPSFEALRKVFNALTPVFDNLHVAIQPLIDAFARLSVTVSGKVAKALGKIDFTTLGKSIKPILAIFKNLEMAAKSILGPIKDAFTEIFPSATGKQLLGIVRTVQLFTATLRLNSNTGENLKRTFAGIFAIFDIGWQIVKGILGVFGKLFTSFQQGSGGILNFTGNIGDFLVSLDQAIKKGHALDTFFNGLATVISLPIKLLAAFGHGLSALGDLIKKIANVVGPELVKGFSSIGDQLGKGGASGGFNGILSAVQTVLLGGIALVISKFFNQGITGLFKGGLIAQIKGAFGQLTTTLKTLETQVKAKTLLLIAGAVATLTASIVALSFIDPVALAKAMAAITASFAELLGAMAILTKITGAAGFVKIPLIASSLILLATAVDVLSIAVIALSKLSWEELAKGLTGVAALMAILAAAAVPLSAASPGIIAAGAAMVPLAFGLTILAKAVKDFGTMDWTVIGKGLIGVAGALVVIAAAMRLMPLTLPITGAGLVLVGHGLEIVAKAMGSFAAMKWKDIGKGLVAIAGALTVIGLAMHLMPLTLPITAAGLILVSIGLIGIAKALKSFGKMSWGEIGKGLTTLAGALIILALGLNAMNGTLTGSAALFVAASALAVLAPVLVVLGHMSWGQIAKGMATLAIAFGVLGLAGLLLEPVTPAILALSVALLAIGLAVGLAGAGLLLLSTGLAALTMTGAAGIPVLISLIKSLADIFPYLAEQAGKGIAQFLIAFANAAPDMLKAGVTLLKTLLQAVTQVAPSLPPAINAMVRAGLDVLITNIPRFADAGIRIIIGFVRAMANRVGDVVDVAVDLIVNFVNAIGSKKNLTKIADAGIKVVIHFIQACATAIGDNDDDLIAAMQDLGVAMAKGLAKGLLGLTPLGLVVSAGKKLGHAAVNAVKSAASIFSPSRVTQSHGKMIALGLALGMSDNVGVVEKSGTKLADASLDAIKKSLAEASNISTIGIKAQPTITPVLDLTDVKKKSSEINSMFDDHPLSANVSLSKANDISNDAATAQQEASSSDTSDNVGTTVTLTQNNTSPKALSTAEIYRNTNSQLALAKEALGIP